METLTQIKSLENIHKRERMEVSPIAGIYSPYQPKTRVITNGYFLLTEVPQFKIISTTITVTDKGESDNFNSAEKNQLNLILLAKKMFANTKPMEGDELLALNKALKSPENIL